MSVLTSQGNIAIIAEKIRMNSLYREVKQRINMQKNDIKTDGFIRTNQYKTKTEKLRNKNKMELKNIHNRFQG